MTPGGGRVRFEEAERRVNAVLESALWRQRYAGTFAEVRITTAGRQAHVTAYRVLVLPPVTPEEARNPGPCACARHTLTPPDPPRDSK